MKRKRTLSSRCMQWWLGSAALVLVFLVSCAPSGQDGSGNSPSFKQEDAVKGTNSSEPTITCYRDKDGDGYGVDDKDQVNKKECNKEFSPVAGDCDDNDPAVNPGVDEVCDELDNDCDGSVDESACAAYVDGQVVSPDGLTLAGVLVEADGQTAVTGQDGTFKFTVGASDRVVVTVQAGEYDRYWKYCYNPGPIEVCYYYFYDTYSFASVTRPVPLSLGESRTLSIILPYVDLRKSIDPSSENELRAKDGTTLEIPAGGIVDADGLPVVEPVELSMTSLVPFVDNMAQAPGDFTGETVEGETVDLESFGMIEAKMTIAGSGEEVFLAEGINAVVEFPIYAPQPPEEGSTIPLWHLDETSTWVEVGESIVTRNDYGQLVARAELPHFSWWNCDQPIYTRHCLNVHVTDSAGYPLEGGAIVAQGVTYAGSSISGTVVNGQACVNVKRDSTVDLHYQPSTSHGVYASFITQVVVPDIEANCPDGACTTVGPVVVQMNTCLSGTVQTSSGQPIANANIFVRSVPETTWWQMGTTGEDGRYATYVREGLFLELMATYYLNGQTYSSPIVPVFSFPSSGPNCVNETALSISGVTCLSGTARSTTGMPLPGAQIWGYSASSGYFRQIATADATGNFIATVKEGELLTVKAATYISGNYFETPTVNITPIASGGPACDNYVLLEMPGLTCLTGSLTTTEGAGVGNHPVTIYTPSTDAYATVTTAPNGLFVATVLEGLEIQIYADVSGSPWPATQVQSNVVTLTPAPDGGPPCPNQVTLQIPAPTCITGLFRDGTGAPVEAGPVYAQSSMDPEPVLIAYTDEFGFFNTILYSGLEYELHAEAFRDPIYVESFPILMTPVLPNDDPCPNNVMLNLPPETCLTGVLYEEDGTTPIDNQRVWTSTGMRTYTDAGGFFFFTVSVGMEITVKSYATNEVTLVPVATVGGPVCENDIILQTQPGGSSSGLNGDVLVWSTSNYIGGTQAVADWLFASGLFASVTAIDVDNLTLADIEPYDAVLFFTNHGGNPANGDVLADYADLGPRLVVSCFAFASQGGNTLGGRLITEEISPVVTAGGSLYTWVTLGSYEASSQFFYEVDAVSGYYHDNVSLTTGADLFGSWSDGEPLVARKENVVAVNLFPDDTWGQVSGDNRQLFINALTAP